MKFEVYQDAKGEYRWKLVAANGRTIADSGEGYTEKATCKAGIELVKRAADARVTEKKILTTTSNGP